MKKLIGDDLSDRLLSFGAVTLFISLALFALVFFPAFSAEIGYMAQKSSRPAVVSKSEDIYAPGGKIFPRDEEFGLVIPKIRINSSVIPDVDPFNSSIYQKQLTKGVAHAKGSGYPDGMGNVFLFAHSSDDWYHANRFNSVFYLINKLEKDDEVYVFYRGKKYSYRVSAKTYAGPDETGFIFENSDRNSLKLMTCWPPGTDIGRLIISADKQT